MIRVVHVPGRTPYARKLRGAAFRIVNDTAVEGVAVPQDLTLAWLLEHRSWSWWDVVHLHHLEFEPVSRLGAVLAECRRAGKRVVFTAHDLVPIFGDRASHHRRFRMLAEAAAPFVCLTPGAEREVQRRWRATTVLAPHGYVAEPGTPIRPVPRRPGPTRFLLYGSLRRNRAVESVLDCWRFARTLRDSTLHLLLRAPSRASMVEDAAVWRRILEHAADPRLLVDVLPFPSDSEVHDAVAAADCVLLPYRWASHSGQLEHALDLGVLAVAARTGFLGEQVAIHAGLVDDPVWFDWSDGQEFSYGARLLAAMQQAHHAVQGGWTAKDPEAFAEHRRREHADVLAAHQRLYSGSEAR